MKIKVADNAGFCFGVGRAVNIAYDASKDNSNVPTYTYGMIIHNNDVVSELKNSGIDCIDNIDEIPDKSRVIIRAHGISEREYSLLNEKNIDIVDATCPYVKKIHQIVKEEFKNKRRIIIIGDKNHPEVQGINGWCNDSAFILYHDEDVAEILEFPKNTPISLVTQTTIRRDLLKKFEEILKKHFTNLKIFDTICNATSLRQESASALAEECDIVFVLGSPSSSNTQKLFEVCREKCPDSFKIENAKELNKYIKILNKKKQVGITAGASTPDKVIKEANLTMAEITNEMNFAEALEETLKPLNTGDIVKGVVIGITPTEVQVDIDGKYDGVIPMDELSNEPINDATKIVNIGDEVDVFVVHVSDRDGVVTLSKKKIDADKGVKELETDFEAKTVLNGRIVEIVKGGVVTIAKGVRVFIPASEAAERFIDDLGSLLNTEASFRIIKMDRDRRGRLRVVGSIKSVAKEISAKKAEEFWANVEERKAYTGTVKMLTNFGAFVDLGGVDGLIHISELSDMRIKHPSEVINVGDSMDVFVKSFDKETGKVSLVKEFKEDKRAAFWAGAEVGKKYNGLVKSLTNFGAFVDIGGVDGLVHISELSWNRIKHPSEVISVGDTIEVYIKELDKETNKISLGYKKEEDSPWLKGTKDLNVGDTVKCKVVRILPFGAFAEIAPFVDGLIHISQISNERIAKPSDALAIGDEVDAKILEINNDTKQIALSIKALLPEAVVEEVEVEEASESYTEDVSFTLGDTLGDILDAE